MTHQKIVEATTEFLQTLRQASNEDLEAALDTIAGRASASSYTTNVEPLSAMTHVLAAVIARRNYLK